MKNNQTIAINLAVLLITSCLPGKPEIKPGEILSTRIITPTPNTPHPSTLEPAIQDQFYGMLLNNGNCDLPCTILHRKKY